MLSELWKEGLLSRKLLHKIIIRNITSTVSSLSKRCNEATWVLKDWMPRIHFFWSTSNANLSVMTTSSPLRATIKSEQVSVNFIEVCLEGLYGKSCLIVELHGIEKHNTKHIHKCLEHEITTLDVSEELKDWPSFLEPQEILRQQQQIFLKGVLIVDTRILYGKVDMRVFLKKLNLTENDNRSCKCFSNRTCLINWIHDEVPLVHCIAFHDLICYHRICYNYALHWHTAFSYRYKQLTDSRASAYTMAKETNCKCSRMSIKSASLHMWRTMKCGET